MARRSTSEKILISASGVASGISPVTLVDALTDDIISPKQIILANPGGTLANVTVDCGSTSWTFVAPAASTYDFTWSDGTECAKGDDVTITSDQSITATLSYVLYDESAGVTKVQSRANTFNNVTATRAPSNVLGQSQS